MINQNAINEALNYLKLNNSDFNFTYVENNGENAISVVKKGKNITIFYSELVTLFYGLSIVKMNLNKESYEINQRQNFKYNGSMFDCSRNQVLSVKQIKEFVLLHSLMGLNRFMLYTEDVYEVEGEPYFGYLRGRYTKDEIKEITDYASNFGVDIVPCIQTLSHFNQAMRWFPYRNMSDTNRTLNVEDERIYEFLEKLIKTCKENFTSKFIHIGMDEAIDMGSSAFLNEQRLINRKEYLLRHLNKVIDICKKYDYIPMMWADMFFKLDPTFKDAYWYRYKGMFPENVKNKIPDVELIYWNYYEKEQTLYSQNLKTCLDTGKQTTFAGGLIRWVGMVGNISPSLEMSSAGLKACLKNKVESVFVTTWGDSGSGASAISLIPALALYSVFDYQNGSFKNVSKLLKAVTGLSLDDYLKLELPNKVRDELLPFENTCYPFLFQDVLLGLFDSRAFDKYEELYKERFVILKRMVKKNNQYSYVYKCYASLCDFLTVKTTLGNRLRKAYKNKDLSGLKDSLERIKLGVKKLEVFINDYYIMWHKESKPFGFEVNDGRLGFVKERMLSAYKIVDKYIKNEIPSIPELEENILPYNTIDDNEPLCVNVFNEIVSANDCF